MRADATDQPVQIAVFTKAPTPGAVKTRLIPTLGAGHAALLQQQLIERALRTACAVPNARVTLWVAGDLADPFIAACAQRFALPVLAQVGADLGARMHHAFAATAARLLLIGTDCPQLQTRDLASAKAALNRHDVVLQPAADGGYVMVGLARPQPALFEAMPWGSAEVLNETLQRIAAAGLRCALLPTRHDLDTAADLQRALAAGWVNPLP